PGPVGGSALYTLIDPTMPSGVAMARWMPWPDRGNSWIPSASQRSTSAGSSGAPGGRAVSWTPAAMTSRTHPASAGWVRAEHEPPGADGQSLVEHDHLIRSPLGTGNPARPPGLIRAGQAG